MINVEFSSQNSTVYYKYTFGFPLTRGFAKSPDPGSALATWRRLFKLLNPPVRLANAVLVDGTAITATPATPGETRRHACIQIEEYNRIFDYLNN